MNSMSVQDLRQALRERGCNASGSKKILRRRFELLHESEAKEIVQEGGKFCVTISFHEKSRKSAPLPLLLKSSDGNANLQTVLKRASNKFRIKARRLFIAETGEEITKSNVVSLLKARTDLVVSTGSIYEVSERKNSEIIVDDDDEDLGKLKKAGKESENDTHRQTPCSVAKKLVDPSVAKKLVDPDPLAATAPTSELTSGKRVPESLYHAALKDVQKLQKNVRHLEKANAKLTLESSKSITRLTTEIKKLTGLEKRHVDLEATISKQASAVNRMNSQIERLNIKNENLKAKLVASKTVAKELSKCREKNSHLKEELTRLRTTDLGCKTTQELQDLLQFYTHGLSQIHLAMAQNLDREKKAMEERSLCKICYASKVQVLLLPCAHYVICQRCSNMINDCPICRRAIAERKLVYTT